ncbi:hypothetical protein HPB50_008689 [Hyalomma asiaticum]|uniref:Uncharacterized protein n=1 Tax=Hyalomma asiaticum TaxID=266040 RepID=A0ACB7RYV2_HYAAI|nr:hypothetical protein HPB50_008689 [Hyalomma asiaticum]
MFGFRCRLSTQHILLQLKEEVQNGLSSMHRSAIPASDVQSTGVGHQRRYDFDVDDRLRDYDFDVYNGRYADRAKLLFLGACPLSGVYASTVMAAAGPIAWKPLQSCTAAGSGEKHSQ